MIKINLIPQELRKKESIFAKFDISTISLQNLPVFNIIAIIAGGIVVLQLAMFLIGMYNRSSLASLNKKYNAILPQKNEADRLKAEVDIINKKAAAIDELMAKRFSWAKKLNALSDSVTSGIWLTELYYDERPVPKPVPAGGQGAATRSVYSMPGALVISGYASSMGEHGASLVGKFIQSLKDNSAFYSDFSEIQLVSIKSDKVDNQEVMNFRIVCFFK